MPIRVNFPAKIVFVALLFACINVSAAKDDIEKFGSWFYQCKTVKDHKACALRHVQVFKDKSPAITLALVDSASSNKLNMHFKVPLGVYLPDGLHVGVDSRKPRAANYLDCNKSGCVGMIDFNKEEVWALKAGKNMKIEYTHQRGKKTMALEVPLDGVSSGITKVWKPKKAKLKADKPKKTTSKKTAQKQAVRKEAARAEAARAEAARAEAARAEAARAEAAQEETVQKEAEADESSGVTNWFSGLFSSEADSNEGGSSEPDSLESE